MQVVQPTGEQPAGAGASNNLDACTVSSLEARNRLRRMRDGLTVALAVQGAASPRKTHGNIDQSEEVEAVIQLVTAEVGKTVETWREAVASEFANVYALVDELRFELGQVKDFSKKSPLTPLIEESTLPLPQEQSAEALAAEMLALSLADERMRFAKQQKRADEAEQKMHQLAVEKDEEIKRLMEQIGKMSSQCQHSFQPNLVAMRSVSPRPARTMQMDQLGGSVGMQAGSPRRMASAPAHTDLQNGTVAVRAASPRPAASAQVDQQNGSVSMRAGSPRPAPIPQIYNIPSGRPLNLGTSPSKSSSPRRPSPANQSYTSHRALRAPLSTIQPQQVQPARLFGQAAHSPPVPMSQQRTFSRDKISRKSSGNLSVQVVPTKPRASQSERSDAEGARGKLSTVIV